LTVTLNGKYAVERRLGGGGMAEVFLARTMGAEGFSRPVAIKRVLDGLSRDPQFADMFIAEAQLSARLQHPNLVSVLDFDRDSDGGLFLVMELVDGVDLHHLLETGRLPFSLVIHLAIEILRGLDYAHELPIGTDGVRGLVHRDISPHNVLLSWEGAVKVSDFGIAKARAATHASGSLVIKGKPSYMSPEQINGRPLDGRSDLFAVGVMMFEMLCSVHLFAGATAEETFGHVLYRDIPTVRDIRPDVPEDLSRVVASLLARDRDRRMPSAEAAIAALVRCANCPKAGREELIETLSHRFVGRAPVRARNVVQLSPSDPTRIAGWTPISNPRPASTSTSDLGGVPTRPRRWGWVIVAGLAGVVVTAGVIGAMVAGRTVEQPGTAAAKPVSAEPPGSPLPAPASPERATAGPTVAAPASRSSEPLGEVPAVSPVSEPDDRREAGAQDLKPVAIPSVRVRKLPATPPTGTRDREPGRVPSSPGAKSEGIREIHL
jgi:serine/threonine-protein kinase